MKVEVKMQGKVGEEQGQPYVLSFARLF
jgi:hypothetical protein